MTGTKNIFADILKKRYSRRNFIQTGALLGSTLAISSNSKAAAPMALLGAKNISNKQNTTLDFAQVPKGYTQSHALPDGYQAQIIARWGDIITASAEGKFVPSQLTAEEQRNRFGYNNDFIAYLPFPYGSNSSSHGLLHVNHEYTNANLMFANIENSVNDLTKEQMQIEQEAHGFTIMEIMRSGSVWQHIIGSPYNRRITANTPTIASGAAKGHNRMQTSADASGAHILGSIANCSGGVTPWGTVLTAEENFDVYFHGKTTGQEQQNHKRYGIGNKTYYGWYRFDKRFNVDNEPNEANRFGWIVEIDPYNPNSTPIKRTSLGRFKHETASCALTADGRLVVYSADDDYFEYIYRFVSHAKVNMQQREANKDLLDDGVLSVAHFADDGSMTWLPLQYGKAPLTEENGFYSQADIVIEARRAADLVGATKMDRPEGVAINPHNGDIFIAMTKNPYRKHADAANPRANNVSGHILRLQPGDGDHAANKFHWEVFILAGNPNQENTQYGNTEKISEAAWFANPDNLSFDKYGRLWIATDGMPEHHKLANGLYATEVTGSGYAIPKSFFRAPKGAEICSPCFTPDNTTLFLSIQHPAEEQGSSFATPTTRWPDFIKDMPPRPSVIAITKQDGGAVGGTGHKQ